MLTLVKLDCAVLSFLLILPDKNCLVVSAGCHTRAPATVSSSSSGKVQPQKS